MLTYNTMHPRLVIPEYGRTLQQMVDHCLTIEDRDERNRCARTIVSTMRTLLPQTGEPEEVNRRLWDHLAIMSDFKLDVDYPYEVIKPDEMDTRPEPISLRPGMVSRRIYGKNIERLIDAAVALEPGEERDALVLLLANQMKKLRLEQNPDGVADEQIFADLEEMSHGALRPDPATTRLHIYSLADLPSGKKKRKKKK